MSISFNVSDIGGVPSHSQLSNLDYANSGHTGFMSSENLIPDGTIYTIEADGSGDFDTLDEVINSLQGKWSNGKVTIQFGAGTFVHDTAIDIRNGDKFFISMLDIKGSGVNDTILDYSTNTGIYDIKASTMTTMWIRSLTVKSNNHVGIGVTGGSTVFLQNVGVYGCSEGIRSESNSNVILVTSIAAENCSYGICSKGGNIGCIGGCATTFKNTTTAFYVEGGGMLRLTNPVYSGTNVTNKTSQTVGTATNNGWITGV